MSLRRTIMLKVPALNIFQVCGFKHYPAPPNYDHVEMPDSDKRKLKFIDKVPVLPPAIRPPKMQKRLKLMRGPEDVHNFLMHKQYGIMALGGGRIKFGHFEMMRLTIGRKMDLSRMFAVWRVDPPWQPITKKGQGQRMGGGKGAIDHYVTPVKPGRIILEVGGKIEFEEVQPFLDDVAMKLPFKAMAVSHKMLEEMKAVDKWEEENNQNYWTMKYLIQNNLANVQQWCSPMDLRYFGKHI